MKKTLLLLFILIFPSAVYVYLTAGKERSFVRLPYYGPKQPIKILKKGKQVTDTVFFSVPSFQCYNQTGQSISSGSFKEKIWVCCFKHLNDDKIAPGMAILINRVEERNDLDTALKIVTFALDSESIASLMKYATMVHGGKKQQFLSGNQGVVSNLATTGLYQPVDSSYKEGFVYFFLIDKEGNIRGIYNGLQIKEADRLIDNIKELEMAYRIKANHDRKNDDDGAM